MEQRSVALVVFLMILGGCAYTSTTLGAIYGGSEYARLTAVVFKQKTGMDVEPASENMIVRLWGDRFECRSDTLCSGMLKGGTISIVDEWCLGDTELSHELTHYYAKEAFGRYGGEKSYSEHCVNAQCRQHADPRLFGGPNSVDKTSSRLWREAQCPGV